VVSFSCIVVVPVCAAATLLNRWLRSLVDVDDGFDTPERVRQAAREMSERLRNLELMLEDGRPRHGAGDPA
jgi:hypothetical protein